MMQVPHGVVTLTGDARRSGRPRRKRGCDQAMPAVFGQNLRTTQ
jgi:hypothetical protein